jgi:uncharacterized damage-inducible protein DinB
MTQKRQRPQQDEYAQYYGQYVDLVPSGDFLEILEDQRRDLIALISPLTDEQAEFRYAQGKWSIKEVIGHITDAERIFGYRLLRIARGDKTPLPGFEQEGYITLGNFDDRSLADLLAEFSAVRESTICLVRSLSQEAWLRRGTASQKEVSVFAMAFIIAGHERHHRIILEKQYLSAAARA